MTSFSDIKAVYEEYFAKVMQLENDRKPTDGLFGIGNKPADDPCHDKFSEDIKAALEDFIEGKPGSRQVSEVMEHILRYPAEHREPVSAFWMLCAVQSHAEILVPMLSAEDAGSLQKTYGKLFPRWDRLPVQQKLYAALGKQKKN